MNVATFAGRLGKAAETRRTGNNNTVTGFSLAVDEYAGGGEKRTLWIDCSMWGDRGEKLAQYLTKGANVTVTGQVGVRTYEGNDGTRAVLTLNVREVTLQGGRQDGDGERQAPQQRQQAPRQDGGYGQGSGYGQQQRPAPQQSAPPVDDDDIPF